jgi:hypothetical protein
MCALIPAAGRSWLPSVSTPASGRLRTLPTPRDAVFTVGPTRRTNQTGRFPQSLVTLTLTGDGSLYAFDAGRYEAHLELGPSHAPLAWALHPSSSSLTAPRTEPFLITFEAGSNSIGAWSTEESACGGGLCASVDLPEAVSSEVVLLFENVEESLHLLILRGESGVMRAVSITPDASSVILTDLGIVTQNGGDVYTLPISMKQMSSYTSDPTLR